MPGSSAMPSRGGLAGPLLPGRGMRARGGRVARWAPLPREPPRPPAVLLEAPRPSTGGTGEATPPRRVAHAEHRLQGRAPQHLPRGGPLARIGPRRGAAPEVSTARIRLPVASERASETIFPTRFPLLLECV